MEFGKPCQGIGFDINAARSPNRARRDQTREVSNEARHLSLTADAASVFIVTAPTPIDAHKRLDLTPLIKASETLRDALGVSVTPVSFGHHVTCTIHMGK